MFGSMGTRLLAKGKLGRLGIKNIAIQNKCLLLKLLHCLHNPDESACAGWIRSQFYMTTMHDDLAGTHWHDLEELLPMYSAVKICKVGGWMIYRFLGG